MLPAALKRESMITFYRSCPIRILSLAALLAGCANTDFVDTDVGPADAGADFDASSDAPQDMAIGDLVEPDGFVLGESVVYAHGATALYGVDPVSLAVTKIADFTFPGIEDDRLTDLAVDRDNLMIGISRDNVYRVDPKTGECTLLSALSDGNDHFVGLSFVTPDDGGDDFLVGIDKAGGQVDQIDPGTGKSTPIGDFGAGLLASGDIVSVKNFGTVATVIDDTNPTDFLARVDIKTGRATIIGDTGYSDIWGLGYWQGTLYGFTKDAEFISIDVKTGAGTLISADTGEAWRGAGVTTSAPVIK